MSDYCLACGYRRINLIPINTKLHYVSVKFVRTRSNNHYTLLSVLTNLFTYNKISQMLFYNRYTLTFIIVKKNPLICISILIIAVINIVQVLIRIIKLYNKLYSTKLLYINHLFFRFLTEKVLI